MADVTGSPTKRTNKKNTASPSGAPATATPTSSPTASPSNSPTTKPTASPTESPTKVPTSSPTPAAKFGPDFSVHVPNATARTVSVKANLSVQFIVRGTTFGRLATVANPRGYVSVVPTSKGCSFDANASHNLTDTRDVVRTTAEQYGCEVAVNAGFFDPPTGACLGSIVSRGTTISNGTGSNVKFAITENGTIMTGYFNLSDVDETFREVVTGQGWLLRNGEIFVRESQERVNSLNLQTTGQSFVNAPSARTAVGHDANGNIMIFGVTGQTWMLGANLEQMASIMKASGAVNAINLDGGGSATFVVNGTVVNTPSDHCGGYQGPFASPLERCARPVTTIVCVHDYDYECPGRNCSGNGSCKSRGSRCECDDGFGGEFCSQIMCPGGMDCSGHGVCSNGTCACEALWQGIACDIPKCPRGCSDPQRCSENDLEECSGRGKCGEDSACTCDAIYTGDACELFLCPQNCSGHGTCSANGTCCCHDGYIGEACLPSLSKAPFDILTAMFACLFAASVFWNIHLWKRASAPSSKGFEKLGRSSSPSFGNGHSRQRHAQDDHLELVEVELT